MRRNVVSLFQDESIFNALLHQNVSDINCSLKIIFESVSHKIAQIINSRTIDAYTPELLVMHIPSFLKIFLRVFR